MSFDEPDGYRDDLATTQENGPRYPTSALSADDYEDDRDAGEDRDEPTVPLRTRGRLTLPEEPESPWRARGSRAWRFTRTLAVTLLVLVGLAGIGNVLIHRYPRTSTHTYQYTNVQRLLIAVDGNGEIKLHGADGDRVTVKTTDRATLLEPVQRQIISSGGQLIISVHCPNSDCSSKYDIEVPRSLSVDALMDHSSDQADITATGLNAAVRLFTGRGNVTVDHLATTADVSITANGRVKATDISAANLDLFAPIGDQIDVHVTGDIQTIQNIRITAGQPAEVTLSVPAGGYRISCVPAGHCNGANGDVTQDVSSPVHQDTTSTHDIQVNVVQNTAKILAG